MANDSVYLQLDHNVTIILLFMNNDSGNLECIFGDKNCTPNRLKSHSLFAHVIISKFHSKMRAYLHELKLNLASIVLVTYRKAHF